MIFVFEKFLLEKIRKSFSTFFLWKITKTRGSHNMSSATIMLHDPGIIWYVVDGSLKHHVRIVFINHPRRKSHCKQAKKNTGNYWNKLKQFHSFFSWIPHSSHLFIQLNWIELNVCLACILNFPWFIWISFSITAILGLHSIVFPFEFYSLNNP